MCIFVCVCMSVYGCLCVCLSCVAEKPPDSGQGPDRVILLVAVPLLVLLVVAMATCALVLWLRSRKPHYRLTYMEEHDVSMMKVPAGTDPTYGVRSGQQTADLSVKPD